MKGRIIRPSQFILAYGVGSIIETDGGSRIIPAFERWGKYFMSKYHTREIIDTNASNQLRKYHGNPRIFSIPTNSDLRQNDGKAIYSLEVFPKWGVCMLHSGTPILAEMSEHGEFDCPSCKTEKQWVKKVTGIRFVVACSKGHVDDVNWPKIVHQKSTDACNNTVFGWKGEGQTAQDITVECAKCHSVLRLSQIYKLAREDKLECSGRFAEKKERSRSCTGKTRLLLRSGSNLRVPDIQVSLTVPYRDSPLYTILSLETIFGIISIQKKWTVKDLCLTLRKALQNNPKIKETYIKEIETYTDSELELTLHQLFRDKNQDSVEEEDVKRDEFAALIRASKDGHPPEHSGKITKFEVEKRKVVEIHADETKWNLSFIVTPIKTLSVVLVQRGYRREVGDAEGELVKTYFEDSNGDAWFPAIETVGEGIFIHLKDDYPNCNSDSNWNMWMKAYDTRKRNYKFHPLFVWWHSLSHRIISSMSVDSGYSSASIRERIYLPTDEFQYKATGGILLYTAQTGGDGTLGGLIAQAENFRWTLNRAARNIDACSNDPLCKDNKMTTTKETGAACYTCMLLSETSCEQRNRLLDRNLLVGAIG